MQRRTLSPRYSMIVIMAACVLVIAGFAINGHMNGIEIALTIGILMVFVTALFSFVRALRQNN